MVSCPKGCKTKYGDQYLELANDEQNLPKSYKCPQCGFEQPLTLKQKLTEIIYRADWYFGVPEHCEVDEYYIENEDEIFEKLLAVIPSVKFARHIAEHLRKGEVLMCKICGQTYSEITGEREVT